METLEATEARERWSHIAVIAGSIAMLVGAIDPMEGSLLILAGSGFVALGTFLGRGERRWLAHRVWTFGLIAVGVGALWGLSAVGGIGGSSGKSMWWAVLVAPYLAGWLMATWGPGSPRWFSWLGVAIGLWYLTILAMVLARSGAAGARQAGMNGAAIGVGCIGLLTIAGCVRRLRMRASPAP